MIQHSLFRVSAFKPLTKEEESAAFRLWRADSSLPNRDRIILGHLQLVYKIARIESRRLGVDARVLATEGVFGLFRAMQSFDEARGFRFSTYASFWIRAFMKECSLNEQSVVRRPATRKPAANRDGSDEVFVLRDVSLNKEDEENGDSWIDSLPDKRPNPEEVFVEEKQHSDNQSNLKMAMNSLSEREQIVIQARFGQDKPVSFTTLGRKLGLSTEGARLIEKRALQKLKRALKQNVLRNQK